MVQFWAKLFNFCRKDSAVDRSGPKKIWLPFPAWFLDLKRVVGDNFVVVNFQTSYFWLYALIQTGDQVIVFRWSGGFGRAIWSKKGGLGHFWAPMLSAK